MWWAEQGSIFIYMSLNVRVQITPCQCFTLPFYVKPKNGDSEKNSCIINADLVSGTVTTGRSSFIISPKGYFDLQWCSLPRILRWPLLGLVSVLPTFSFWSGLSSSCGRARDCTVAYRFAIACGIFCSWLLAQGMQTMSDAVPWTQPALGFVSFPLALALAFSVL